MTKIKTGGREKGTPNKVTTDLRSVLQSIVSYELEHLQTHIHQMPDEQRTQVLLKLLPYVTPKTQAITYTEDRPIKPLVMRILQVGEDIDNDIEDQNDFVVQVVNKPHQDQKSV
jgi:DNA topoisomerase VI subunit B